MEEKVKAPFWKQALIYGAILGFVSVFLSLVFYFIGKSTESWTGYISGAIGIALLVYLLLQYRKDHLGGYATFGQMFTIALVAGIVSTIIAASFSYVLNTVIDPGLIDQFKIAAEEKIMNNSRIPESMYDDIFEKMEKRTTAAYITKMALIVGPIMNAIIALIVAAFLKKEENINSPV
jgi:hypothetical protein